ncbi:MAG: carcinine hydrolase/isopenicillin-N N-acyltransferase family protein [Anaerolineae bacterium]|jgi:hypothetical protein
MAHPCSAPELRHCTVITVSQGNRVFFGGNDDYVNRDSTYWIDPGGETGYGAIYFGDPDNVQQGFNAKGLAYDANGTPKAPITSHPGRKPVYGGYNSYPIHILKECATVEEVIAWVQEHRWHTMMHDQLHFADATGDAVVISAGRDGKVAFTRKPAGDGFLVSTNFNLANPTSGGYPCWRYRRAEEWLNQIQSPDELAVERMAAIMEAVHVEGPSGWTLYSVVGDLPQRLVYIYFMFQYDAPIVLNIDQEIGRSQSPRPLSELFPEETQLRASKAYRRLVSRSDRCDVIGFAWLGAVVASLVVLFLLARLRGRGLAFWSLVVAVLGPAGLLAWRLVSRDCKPRALVEAIGDLPPYVAGMVAALLLAVNVPTIAQNQPLQLAAFYGLPLIAGLFLYQAPLMAWARSTSYARAVFTRLPAALVSTHLALAGLLSLGLPLVNWHLGYCGLDSLAFLWWWPIAVVGSLAGAVLLYAYHTWSIRRGFATWSALLWDTEDNEGNTKTIARPTWRRLGFWIVLSFVILVSGIALGAIGSAWVAGAG